MALLSFGDYSFVKGIRKNLEMLQKCLVLVCKLQSQHNLVLYFYQVETHGRH